MSTWQHARHSERVANRNSSCGTAHRTQKLCALTSLPAVSWCINACSLLPGSSALSLDLFAGEGSGGGAGAGFLGSWGGAGAFLAASRFAAFAFCASARCSSCRWGGRGNFENFFVIRSIVPTGNTLHKELERNYTKEVCMQSCIKELFAWTRLVNTQRGIKRRFHIPNF